MNGHPYMRLDRAGALSTIASHLHHMLAHLRAAEYFNLAHGLGLELPSEKQLIDLISTCVQQHQQMEKKP